MRLSSPKQSLRARFLIAAGFITIPLLALAAWVVISMNQAFARLDRVAHESHIEGMMELETQTKLLRVSSSIFKYSTGRLTQEEASGAVSETDAVFHRLIAVPFDDDAEVEKVNDLHRRWLDARPLAMRILSSPSPQNDPRARLLENKFDADVETLRAELRDMTAQLRTELITEEQSARQARFRSNIMLGGAAALALLTILTFAVQLARSILKPLARLETGVRHLGDGDLSHRVPAGKTDEMGQLTQAFNDMAARLEASQKELKRASAERDTRIEEARAMQESVRISEERFRLVAQNASDLIYEWHVASNEILWLGDIDAILGYDPGTFPRTLSGWEEALHEEDRPRIMAAIDKSLESAEAFSDEYRVRRKSGEILYWTDRATIVRDENGQVTRWIGATTDITARRQQEQAALELRNQIEEQRQRLNTIIDSVPGIVWEIWFEPDPARQRVNFVSAYVKNMVGYTEEEWLSIPNFWFSIVHPEDQPAIKREEAALLARGHGTSQFRWIAKDGHIIWAETHLLAIRDEKGQPIGLRGVTLDITQNKEAEEALGFSEERFRLMGENIGEVFWMTSPDGQQILHISQAYERMWGRSMASLYEHPHEWIEAIIEEDRARVSSLFSKIAEGKEFKAEYRIRRPDGTLCWIEDRGYPIQDESGEISFIAGVAGDITERKRSEVELDKARQELEDRVTERTKELAASNRSLNEHIVEWQMAMQALQEAVEAHQSARLEADEANRSKSEFLSRMSHELRTPLNAILGFGQILEMEKLSEDSGEAVTHILKAGRHLLDLINEVLDISRIEAGGMHLSPEPVDVRNLIQEVLDLITPNAASNHIVLDNQVTWEDGLFVLADNQRIKQVLINLVSNAIKYNRESGRVTVTCRPAAEGMLRIGISDTGFGLGPDDIAKLFIPFQRLHALNSDIEGTGIGLALSKRLTEAMGGKIGVESALGNGSTFWVDLPRAESPVANLNSAMEERAELFHPKSQLLRNILYIEDNLSNLRVIEMLIDRIPDLHLLTAIQGSVALSLARQHHPDLILLDLHLPDITGDEVLRRLKADQKTRNIPVVMLSADATPSQIERLLAAGARKYLTKPLDVKIFLQTLEDILGRGRETHAH